MQAQINGQQVTLQLDTASDISIISEQTWREIGQPVRQPTTVETATASGDHLKLEFQCVTEININGVVREGCFYVVKQQLNLLGLDLIDEFNFWEVPINHYCNQDSSSPSLGALKAASPVQFVSTSERAETKIERGEARSTKHWSTQATIRQRGSSVQGVEPALKLPLDAFRKEFNSQQSKTPPNTTITSALSPRLAPHTNSLVTSTFGVHSEHSKPVQSVQSTADPTVWRSPELSSHLQRNQQLLAQVPTLQSAVQFKLAALQGLGEHR